MSNINKDLIKIFPINSGAVDRTLSEQNLSRLIKAILPGKKSFVVGEYTDDKSISWVQFFIDGRLFDIQKNFLTDRPCYVKVGTDNTGAFDINEVETDQNFIEGIELDTSGDLKILDINGNIPLDSLDSIDVDGGEI